MAKVAAVHQKYLLDYSELIGINEELLLKNSHSKNDYDFSTSKGLINANQYLEQP